MSTPGTAVDGHRCISVWTSAVPGPRPCHSSATAKAVSAVVGSAGSCTRRARSAGRPEPSGGEHDERQRDVMHAVNVVGEALDHRVVEVIERGGEAVLWDCGGRRRNRSRSVSALVDSSGLISASVPDQHTYLVATSDSRTCRPSARQSGNRYTALQQLQPKPGSGGLPRRAPCAAEPGIRVMASVSWPRATLAADRRRRSRWTRTFAPALRPGPGSCWWCRQYCPL
jgi:hypothetical protein